MLSQRIIKFFLCKLSYKTAAGLFNNSSEKEILLTFDDGPHPDWTPTLLDFLKENNIKGIFFVVGKNVAKYPNIIRRMSKEGHVIANHTYDHKDVNQVSNFDFVLSYKKCEKEINKITGGALTPLFFRPPRGLLNICQVVFFLLKRVHVLLWSTDSGDSAFSSVDRIIEIINSSDKKKEILLFHDDSRFVLDILEKAVPLWKEKGYMLVSQSK